jgi:3-methylfumaryl-CoA hydratase
MDESFREWIGRTETVRDPLSAVLAQAVQATLDSDAPTAAAGDALPLAWQWFFFLPRAPQAQLDADGHPQRGGFLPPIPYPRRMFAGARMTRHAPLVVGEPAERIGTVRDIVQKSGKSGSLAFVTVAYRFVQRGVTCTKKSRTSSIASPGHRCRHPCRQRCPRWPAARGRAPSCPTRACCSASRR